MNNDNTAMQVRTTDQSRRKFITLFIIVQLIFYFYFQIRNAANSSNSTSIISEPSTGDDPNNLQPLGGENIFDDVHSYQYKRDQEYNYNYNQNKARLSILAQDDAPYNFVLSEIAAFVYFDFVFHSSILQERNYFNLISWDSFVIIGDRFKRNEKIYFRFLYPKEENMILRIPTLSTVKKPKTKLDFEEYNRWDSRLSLSQQESFLKHFIQMTFGSKGFSLAYSEGYKMGHLEEENSHFKHLQKQYLKTANDNEYMKFLKNLRQHEKSQQESNRDKLREESIFINEKPKDKFSDYPTFHITDILNLESSTSMEVESLEFIQKHFEILLHGRNIKRQQRLKYFMKHRAIYTVLFSLEQQKLLGSFNQTQVHLNEETGDLKADNMPSIYLLLASSPDWIRSWFTYKIQSADSNALRHSSKKKILLNKLMASIKQEGHSRHSQIKYLIKFNIQGICDTYCRLNLIKTYFSFKELQSNFPNIFKFSFLFQVDESITDSSLSISIEKEEQQETTTYEPTSPKSITLINNLNCKMNCIKEIVQHHGKKKKKKTFTTSNSQTNVE